jgi:hypothetical protein
MKSSKLSRTEHKKLSPTKRASLLMDAMLRRDAAKLTALMTAPYAVTYPTVTAQMGMFVIAGAVFSQSKEAEVAYLQDRLALCTAGVSEDDEKPQEYLKRAAEHARSRIAWILALEALDKETGAAYCKAMDIIASGYASWILERAEGQQVDYAPELRGVRELRKTWELL